MVVLSKTSFERILQHVLLITIGECLKGRSNGSAEDDDTLTPANVAAFAKEIAMRFVEEECDVDIKEDAESANDDKKQVNDVHDGDKEDKTTTKNEEKNDDTKGPQEMPINTSNDHVKAVKAKRPAIPPSLDHMDYRITTSTLIDVLWQFDIMHEDVPADTMPSSAGGIKAVAAMQQVEERKRLVELGKHLMVLCAVSDFISSFILFLFCFSYFPYFENQSVSNFFPAPI